MALPSHRYREVEQFVRLSGAVALGLAPPGPRTPTSPTSSSGSRPESPRCGCTSRRAAELDRPRLRPGSRTSTRRPARHNGRAGRGACGPRSTRGSRSVPALRRDHRHPEADPAHPQRLRLQLPYLAVVGLRCRPRATCCWTCCRSRTTCRSPARACRGSCSRARRWRLSTSARAQRRVRARPDTHRVTHIHVVPALLIRWINDPGVRRLRPDLDASHPERRPAPAARDPQARPQRGVPQRHRAGELRHGRGPADVRPRSTTREDVRLETVGRPICPDDEVRLVDDDGLDVRGRGGRRAAGRAARTRCAATTTRPSTTRARSPRTASTAPAT